MVTHKGTPIRIPADFLAETLQAKRRVDILKILKDKNCQLRILYPAKLSFRYGEVKAFPDKQKRREFINSGPALQEMLKGSLLPETKRQKYTNL